MKFYEVLKRVFSVVLLCVLTFVIMLFMTGKENNHLTVSILGQKYSPENKIELSDLIDKYLGSEITLRTVYDDKKVKTLNMSDLGMSYLSDKEIKYANFCFNHKRLFNVWKELPVLNEMEPFYLSKNKVFYDEEKLRQYFLSDEFNFDFKPVDSFLVEYNGSIYPIAEQDGFKVKKEAVFNSLTTSISQGNFDHVFLEGEIVPPMTKVEDIQNFNVFVAKISSNPNFDKAVFDNLLYIFSSLNNYKVLPYKSFKLSECVSKRINELQTDGMFDSDTEEEVVRIFESIFNTFRTQNIQIDEYSSDVLSIGSEDDNSRSAFPVITIKNNRTNPIMFSCYAENANIIILITTEH